MRACGQYNMRAREGKKARRLHTYTRGVEYNGRARITFRTVAALTQRRDGVNIVNIPSARDNGIREHGGALGGDKFVDMNDDESETTMGTTSSAVGRLDVEE